MEKGFVQEKALAISLSGLNLWQLIGKCAVITLEISWVLPWYLWMTRSAITLSRLQFYLVFGAIYAGSGFLLYATQLLRLHERARKSVLILSFLASLTLAFVSIGGADGQLTLASLIDRWKGPDNQIFGQLTPLIVTMLLSGLAWRRGITLAMQNIGPLAAMRSFRIGIVMFIVYGLVVRQLGAGAPDVELIIFFFSGLIALSGGRFSFLGYVRGGSQAPSHRRLVVTVAIITAAMVSLMLLVGVSSRGTFAEGLRQLLLFLFGLLAQLLLTVVKPLVYFAVRAFEWLLKLLQPLFDQSEDVVLDPLFSEDLQEFFAELDAQMVTPQWFTDLSIWGQRLMVWGAVVLVVVVLFYGIRRWRTRFPAQSEEERESLVGSMDLKNMLLSLLRRRGRGALKALHALRPGERVLAAAHIRRIYTELLELCAHLGHSRPASRTPTEFLPQLTSLFPSLEQDVTNITQAYVRVRYGELPEFKEQIEAIDAAWFRIKDEGERKKKAGLQTD